MSEPVIKSIDEMDRLDLYAELDRLRALAADLRNQLYLLGQNVKEADAILLGKTAKEEQ